MSAPDASRPPTDPSPAPPTHVGPSREAWGSAAGLAVLSALWFGWRLGEPLTPYWDEGFYLTDARRFFRPDALLDNPEHPPLGKWLIGLAIQLVGDGPVGWRIASCVASVLLIASLPLWLEAAGLVGPRAPRWLLVVPSLLLLVDPMTSVIARVAMLDALLNLFYVSAAMALLVSLAPGTSPDRARRARLAAGVLAGLALGTKWTALTLVPVFLLGRFRVERGHVRADWRGLAELFAPFALVYLGCFALPGATRFGPHAFPQVDGPLDPELPWPIRVVLLHGRMVAYHTYYYQCDQRSSWYEWLIARQALWLSARLDDAGRAHVIAAFGSPIGWLAAELATLVVLVRALRERHLTHVALGAFAVVQLTFWAVVLRMTLVYYMSAILPFCAIALTVLLARHLDEAKDRPRAARLAAIGVAALLAVGVGWHAYTLPLSRGEALTEEELAAYAHGPAGVFLFHDAIPLDRAMELLRTDGFGAARLEE